MNTSFVAQQKYHFMSLRMRMPFGEAKGWTLLVRQMFACFEIASSLRQNLNYKAWFLFRLKIDHGLWKTSRNDTTWTLLSLISLILINHQSFRFIWYCWHCSLWPLLIFFIATFSFAPSLFFFFPFLLKVKIFVFSGTVHLLLLWLMSKRLKQ